MKLNYKRTILVGFAFFLISAFWQAYDATIPVILTNKFGMSQTWSGVIMALDNILAVFMLPLFGAFSDKCNTRYGKRTPFITIGAVVAAVALIGLSFVDNVQLKNISAVSKIDDPAALTVIYETQSDRELQTPEGERFVLEDKFTKDEFVEIKSVKDDKTNPDYTNYVVPARQAYAADVTENKPAALVTFVGLLLLVLVAMATFRSPAVALMPDVTIKPLRSKANAVINLMGTAGGILVLVLGMVFATSAVKNAMMSYTVYYAVIAGIMLTALSVFLLTVREPKWSRQMQEDSVALGIEENDAQTTEKRGLSSSEKRSLILILASIALWYFGYNAVTSKYAVYAGNILNMDYNTTLLLAQAAAIVAYLPAGIVASKMGRKKTILAGVIMLATAFGFASFMRAGSSVLVMNCLFALAGIGWATINVNSFPMVVEMCSGADIGKYTGFYYTASMSAQIVTPVLSGALMDKMGMTVLFPYAAVFAALAFATMFFVKHGDNKVAVKKGLEALDIDD
ncbi:MAG: SLC45 family MFS transporter [Ruminococcaceae bacterium]|nr:SLC45 family MFS transporter [Oscillospiraceae bacterium]